MFNLVSSPHMHSNNSTQKQMLWVIFAMFPAFLAMIVYFGYGVIFQTLIAVVTALVLEIIVTLLRKKPLFFYISDYSAVLSAVILAIAIPPYAPYWIILIGIFCTLILGKHVYGGLGQNPFNPAMVGYVILLISFPVQMTNWITPVALMTQPPGIADSISLIASGVTQSGETLHQLIAHIDGISQATPLNSVKTGLQTGHHLTSIFTSPLFSDSLSLNLASGWWQVNFAFMVGGIVLLWQRVIAWHIPVAMLTTFTVLTTISWLSSNGFDPNPIWELLSGATMFCAFFIATDPVTASTTPRGRLIFGTMIGFLVFIIRYFAGYPDGVAFAVLLANICVPFIDHYSKPRVFGH